MTQINSQDGLVERNRVSSRSHSANFNLLFLSVFLIRLLSPSGGQLSREKIRGLGGRAVTEGPGRAGSASRSSWVGAGAPQPPQCWALVFSGEGRAGTVLGEQPLSRVPHFWVDQVPETITSGWQSVGLPTKGGSYSEEART